MFYNFFISSRVAGFIIGIMTASSLLIVCIYYYRYRLTRKESQGVKSYLMYPIQTSLYSNVLIFSLTDGKGFAGGRGGSGFKGGSKSSGTFAGASSYNRPNSYKPNIVQTQGGGGGGFKGKAISFAAGAASGIAAYSLMKSMSSSFHSRPGGNYEPGYGVGDTCVNNEEMNGTAFGQFRCPLNGFPYEAKSCCGEHEKQFCCIPERSSRLATNTSNFGWIILFMAIVLVTLLLCIRYRRHQKKEIVTIPTGSQPTNENSYGVPPANPIGNFNPYVKQPVNLY
ncbi:unnamed protein product [Rotaria socialis]|uniref:Shisa N-terminal domain-containing protein n=1 Tax=Rotaria socialis TaxID=392032 RepID=A0A820YLQ5_9BILA|nr:unnamed protein product [Rotaria socialis]